MKITEAKITNQTIYSELKIAATILLIAAIVAAILNQYYMPKCSYIISWSCLAVSGVGIALWILTSLLEKRELTESNEKMQKKRTNDSQLLQRERTNYLQQLQKQEEENKSKIEKELTRIKVQEEAVERQRLEIVKLENKTRLDLQNEKRAHDEKLRNLLLATNDESDRRIRRTEAYLESMLKKTKVEEVSVEEVGDVKNEELLGHIRNEKGDWSFVCSDGDYDQGTISAILSTVPSLAGMINKIREGNRTLNFRQFPRESLHQLLDWIYFKKIPALTFRKAIQLFALADLLLYEPLKTKCLEKVQYHLKQNLYAAILTYAQFHFDTHGILPELEERIWKQWENSSWVPTESQMESLHKIVHNLPDIFSPAFQTLAGFIEKDAKKKIQILEREAKRQYPGAQYELAQCYYRGQGVDKNKQIATALYEQAAKQGHNGATLALAFECADPAKAKQLIRKAAEGGHAMAQNELARKLERENHMQEAAKYYELSALQNYSDGQVNFGLCLEDGSGVDRNLPKAMEWYELAAKQNNPRAYNQLCRCYYRGIHFAKNPEQAFFYARRSADLGDKIGKFNLGTCYMDGVGVPVNKELALQNFLEAETKDAELYIKKLMG